MKHRHFPFIFICILLLFSYKTYSQEWSMISSGAEFTIALHTNGTLWAWGANDVGQLANATDEEFTSEPLQVTDDSDWLLVEAGSAHVIAIKQDGTLWAWGLNIFGQLGIGETSTFENSPVQVGSDNDWQKVSAYYLHTLALKKDGSLWAWGGNTYGTIGDGTFENRLEPVQIGQEQNWTQISAGGYHSLAIDTSGTLWSWGDNTHGQLGINQTGGQLNILQKVQTLDNVSHISAGLEHALALLENGSIYSWGRNNFGQLGMGPFDYEGRITPARIGFYSNWITVECGTNSSFTINEEKEMYAWGYNNHGNLGISTNIVSPNPTLVTYMKHWSKIAPSIAPRIPDYQFPNHTVGIRGESKYFCTTGDNEFGQLGNNNDFSRVSFVCDVEVTISGNNAILSQQSLAFYPNPGPGIFQINWEEIAGDQLELQISSVSGHDIGNIKINRNENMNLTFLNPGMYLIHFLEKNTHHVQKLVIHE